MSWLACVWYGLTLCAALWAIIEGEQDNRGRATIMTFLAGADLFIALMLS